MPTSFQFTAIDGLTHVADSDHDLSEEELQQHVNEVNADIQAKRGQATLEYANDALAGRGRSYTGTAARSFVAPLSSAARGVGESLEIPALIRGGNDLDARTRSAFPVAPRYGDDLAGKVIGSTAGLAGAALPFLVPGIGPELGTASLVPQTYDSGYQQAQAANLPAQSVRDAGITNALVQTPLMALGGRVTRGLIAGPAVAEGMAPTLAQRATEAGVGALEAGGIGGASKLAENIQARGNGGDPDRPLTQGIGESAALMAAGGGLLAVPRLGYHALSGKPTISQEIPSPGAGEQASNSDVVGGQTPSRGLSGESDTRSTEAKEALGPTPQGEQSQDSSPDPTNVPAEDQPVSAPEEKQPSFLPPLSGANAADSGKFFEQNALTDQDLTRQLYQEKERRAATPPANYVPHPDVAAAVGLDPTQGNLSVADIQNQINRTSNRWMQGLEDPLDLDPARSLSNVAIPPDLGERFQGHGLRLGGDETQQLASLLQNGIEPARPFHSTSLESDKPGGVESGLGGNANSRSGVFTVISKPDSQFKEGGIGGVLVDDKHSAIIPELQAKFPGVPFAKTTDAPELMRSLLAQSEQQAREAQVTTAVAHAATVASSIEGESPILAEALRQKAETVLASHASPEPAPASDTTVPPSGSSDVPPVPALPSSEAPAGTSAPSVEPALPSTLSAVEPAAEPAPTGSVPPVESIPERASGDAITSPQVAPENRFRPLVEMTGSELDQHYGVVRDAARNVDVAVFGEQGAKRYQNLLRAENSLDPAVSDRASAAREAMEAALPETDRNKLFGIGDTAANAEEVREIRDAVQYVEGARDAEQLGEALKFAATKFDPKVDPSTYTFDQAKAAAQMLAARRVVAELGLDPNEVGKAMVRQVAGRFSDVNDAADMLAWLAPDKTRPQESTSTGRLTDTTGQAPASLPGLAINEARASASAMQQNAQEELPQTQSHPLQPPSAADIEAPSGSQHDSISPAPTTGPTTESNTKEGGVGSRVKTPTITLSGARPEYTRATLAMPEAPNETSLLHGAITALERLRPKLESDLSGYQNFHPADTIIDDTLGRFHRQLRRGILASDAVKPDQVLRTILNSSTRDFLRAAKPRENMRVSSLDEPVGEEGGATRLDRVADTRGDDPEYQERATKFGQHVKALVDGFVASQPEGIKRERLESALQKMELRQNLTAADKKALAPFLEYVQTQPRPDFTGRDSASSEAAEAGAEQGEPAPADPEADRGGQAADRPDPRPAESGTQATTPDGQQGAVERPTTAQGAPERTQGAKLRPEHEAVLNRLLSETAPAFERLGYPVREVEGPDASGLAIGYGGESGQMMEVNRGQLAKNLDTLGDDHEAAARYLSDGINEELRHAADRAEARSRWEAAGSKGDFDEFYEHDKAILLTRVTNDLTRLSPGDRAVAEGALLDGWNLYHGQEPGDALHFTSVPELFRHLDTHPGETANYMAETLRQLTQARDTGQITETGFQSIVAEFREFVSQLLSRLRLVAQDPQAYSPALADAISRLETVLKGTEGMARGEEPPGGGRGGRLEAAPVRTRTIAPGASDPHEAERELIEKLSGIKPPVPTDKPIDLPSARQRAEEVVSTARTFGRQLVERTKRIGQLSRLTDKDVVLRKLAERQDLNDFYADNLAKAYRKAVPDRSAREAITVFNDVGGDRAALEAAARDSKNKSNRERYERALNLSPDELRVAESLRDFYKAKLDEGQQAGILTEGRDNYINRIVKQPFLQATGRDGGGNGAGSKLSRQFRFAAERQFPTLLDVEKAGYTPATYDSAELAGIYAHELGKAKLTRQFVEDLKAAKGSDGRPLAAVKGDRPKLAPGFTEAQKQAAIANDRSDYVANEKLGTFGNLAFHPEAVMSGRTGSVANALKTSAITRYLNEASNNPFSVVGKGIIRGTQKFQSIVKATMFDLSPFHATTEAVHALGHRINPAGKIENFDPSNPEHAEMVAAGLKVIPNIGGSDHFAEGLGGGSDSLVQKIPGVGRVAKSMSDFLFHDYIPSLKIKTFRAAMERNMERFQPQIDKGELSRQDVAALTADQVNDGYGHQNYTALARNPTVQHIFRLVALAPDFLESRFKFTTRAASGLLGGLAGREQLVAMSTLFFAQYLIARAFNKLDHNDYEFDHPFSLVHGNRSYTLRSVPGDIVEAIKDTGKFLAGRESPGVRAGVQFLTGRNYRGERVTTAETAREMATQAVPISFAQLPGFRQLSTTQQNATTNWWQNAISAMGLHVGRVSPEAEVYAAASKFRQAKGEKEDVGVYPTSPLTPIKYALQDNDLDRARSEMEKLAANGKSRMQILRSLKDSILHPFTGSQASDQEFLRGLKGADRDAYVATQKMRVQMVMRARELVARLPVRAGS